MLLQFLDFFEVIMNQSRCIQRPQLVDLAPCWYLIGSPPYSAPYLVDLTHIQYGRQKVRYQTPSLMMTVVGTPFNQILLCDDEVSPAQSFQPKLDYGYNKIWMLCSLSSPISCPGVCVSCKLMSYSCSESSRVVVHNIHKSRRQRIVRLLELFFFIQNRATSPTRRRAQEYRRLALPLTFTGIQTKSPTRRRARECRRVASTVDLV